MSGQQRAPHTCAILPVPVKAALACWAGTLIAAWGVDAAKAAASLIDATLVHIPAMSDTRQKVASMTETLEASWGVDTHVVTGSIEGALIYILAAPFVDEKLVALLAAAFKAVHCVGYQNIYLSQLE